MRRGFYPENPSPACAHSRAVASRPRVGPPRSCLAGAPHAHSECRSVRAQSPSFPLSCGVSLLRLAEFALERLVFTQPVHTAACPVLFCRGQDSALCQVRCDRAQLTGRCYSLACVAGLTPCCSSPGSGAATLWSTFGGGGCLGVSGFTPWLGALRCGLLNVWGARPQPFRGKMNAVGGVGSWSSPHVPSTFCHILAGVRSTLFFWRFKIFTLGVDSV